METPLERQGIALIFWEDNISTVYRRCRGLQKRSRWRFYAGGSGPALFGPQFMCRNSTIASGRAEYDEPYGVSYEVSDIR
jgi:hypothetical protein